MINECSLISALNSDQIVTFEEVFDFNHRICVYLEMMDGGDLAHIILTGKDIYSEEFCKYTLLMVARALQTMHRNNVLHRDIKADNILCKTNGEVKIADLGLSVFLSE